MTAHRIVSRSYSLLAVGYQSSKVFPPPGKIFPSLSQSQGTGTIPIYLKHFSKFFYISVNAIGFPLLQSQFILPGISTLFVEGPCLCR